MSNGSQPSKTQALGLEMDRHENHEEVEHGAEDRRDRNGRVRDVRDLGHDERAGAHHGRHDLPAHGSRGLDAGREGRLYPSLIMAGIVKDRSRRRWRRTNRDGPEQRGGDHLDLGRPSAIAARDAGSEIVEEATEARALDEGAEDDEHGDHRGEMP
jgi:hypothetical protein